MLTLVWGAALLPSDPSNTPALALVMLVANLAISGLPSTPAGHTLKPQRLAILGQAVSRVCSAAQLQCAAGENGCCLLSIHQRQHVQQAAQEPPQVQPTYDVPGPSPGSKHAQNARAAPYIKHPGAVKEARVALQCIAIGLSPHLRGSS